MKLEEIKHSIDHIGNDPFKPSIRNDSFSTDIEQLLWRLGYFKDNVKYFNTNVPEVCFNPMVIDKYGNEIEFQRGIVWTLEQKQLLIESIYNNIDIGKFVVRMRSFKWVEKRITEGKIEHTAFADIIDGVQRSNALIEFVENRFKDFNGNLFSDLSKVAQRKFKSYRNLTLVQVDENATDKDIISLFLSINFAGVPMSKEHIEYVKSINI